MDKEKESNEIQENEIESLEQKKEQDPFNPEKSLEEIKEKAFEKGEKKVESAEEEIDKDFENFSEIVENENELITELEQVKDESKKSISESGQGFREKLKNIEKANNENSNEANKAEKELILSSAGSTFAEIKQLEKSLKTTKNPEKATEINEKIEAKKKELSEIESRFDDVLVKEMGQELKENPELSDAELVEKHIIPGLSSLSNEKLKAVTKNTDNKFVDKFLKFVGKHAPKSHMAKTATVAVIVAAGATIIGGTGGLPIAYALGSKIARSIVGSVIGEKVGEFVGEKIEKRNDKKRRERLSKGLDDSLETMKKLAEEEMKISARQEKVKKVAKFASHLLTAGGIMGSLKFLEYGAVEAIKHGAEHGLKSTIEAASSLPEQELNAFLLKKASSSLDYGITIGSADYVGEQFINEAGHKANPGSHH